MRLNCETDWNPEPTILPAWTGILEDPEHRYYVHGQCLGRRLANCSSLSGSDVRPSEQKNATLLSLRPLRHLFERPGLLSPTRTSEYINTIPLSSPLNHGLSSCAPRLCTEELSKLITCLALITCPACACTSSPSQATSSSQKSPSRVFPWSKPPKSKAAVFPAAPGAAGAPAIPVQPRAIGSSPASFGCLHCMVCKFKA